jgi:sigma-B regulation protein RsbU (phosphoserine phosphatase)
MQSPLRSLRIWIIRTGLWPNTRYARVTCYLTAFDLLLFALKRILELSGSSAASLGFWIELLGLISAGMLLSLAYRWLKAKMLWRLRNRLIVTYVFIGVIPAILLVTMAFGTLYLFAAQFANFVVTSEFNARLRSLGMMNSGIAGALISKSGKGESVTQEFIQGVVRADNSASSRQVCVWRGTQDVPICRRQSGMNGLLTPSSTQSRFDAIVLDNGALYIRSADVLNVNGQTLTVVSSEPLDRKLLSEISSDLGEISLDAGASELGATKSSSGENRPELRMIAGNLPPASGNFDFEIKPPPPLPEVVAPFSVMDWKTGKTDPLGGWVRVRTRPSTLYPRLFAATAFVKGMESVLVILAIAFAVIVVLALIIGTRLTRTVTHAIAQLYLATRHINQGDFSHRIPVTSNDQLATLSHSFNSMSESLQKLIEEQKEKQKLENELVIAQEVQAQLFPRKISQLPSLEVHGFCRPARTVSGDYYDFLTVDPDRMVLAVGDVSGKGISAALLMATIHSAVRAYSLDFIDMGRNYFYIG